MAALTIGRVGLDVTFDTAPSIGGMEYGAAPGEAVTTLSGWIHADTLAETKALRDELYAQAEYVDVIPVTYAGDSTLDGFYRVDSVAVTMNNYIATGLAEFSISLRRVGDSGSVGFQSRLTTALRTNSRSVTSTQAKLRWGWPSTSIYIAGDSVITSSGGISVHPPGDPTNVVSSASGTIAGNTVSAGTPISSTFDPVIYIPPANFYDAGCEVWVDDYQRAGLWIPDDADNWFMTNGMIRVGRDTSADSRFYVENWIGNVGFESKDYWQVQYNQTAWTDLGNWSGIRILHNRPEYAAVRLYGRWLSNRNPAIVDLAIRRSVPIIYGHLWTDFAPSNGFRIGRVSADGSTAVTGGIVRTTAHTDGSKWGLFAAAPGVTFSTTSDYLELSGSYTETDFGIGLDLENSGGNWTVDDELLDTYYGLVADNMKAITQ
jgi:phage protein U